MRRISLFTVLAVVLCTGFGTASAAQDAGAEATVSQMTVKNRKRDGFDPVGVRVGSYFLYPFATTGVLYDDNVFSVNLGEETDTIWTSTGGLLLQSDWGRHLLDFEFGVSNFVHAEFSDEDHTDFYGKAIGRIDVSRDFNIGVNAGAARLTEPRGSSDSPTSAAEPTQYTKIDASVSFNKQFNRIGLQVGGAVQDLDYDDVDAIGGGKIDQDVRDGQIYTAVLKTSYEFSPGYRAFALVEGNWREFGDNSLATLRRNSDGIETRGGVEFEISRVMSGTISAGYLRQEYDAAVFDPVEGVAAEANILWNPTMLMTVELNAKRRVSETTFSTASGHLDTLLSAKVDYEILRNLIGSANVSYIKEEYEGVKREDDTLSTGVSLEYLINRNMSAQAYYVFTTKDSTISNFNYDKNQVGGSVKVQF